MSVQAALHKRLLCGRCRAHTGLRVGVKLKITDRGEVIFLTHITVRHCEERSNPQNRLLRYRSQRRKNGIIPKLFINFLNYKNMKKLKLNIKAIISALILSAFTGSAFAQTLLTEQFASFTNNIIGNSTVQFNSGFWEMFYVNGSYSNLSISECAILHYSSSNMGYMVTPAINKPGTLTFDARLQQSNESNSVIIQKSVNGGPFTEVERVSVTGTTYLQYSVAIDETSDNVRIKFLRNALSSESSNYNIAIDNVVITADPGFPPLTCGQSPDAKLEVRDGQMVLGNGQTSCYGSDASSLTLVNVGNAPLSISQIIVSGGYSLSSPVTLPASLAPCQDMTISISAGSSSTAIGAITIKSNDAQTPAYIVSLYNK